LVLYHEKNDPRRGGIGQQGQKGRYLRHDSVEDGGEGKGIKKGKTG